MRRASTGERHGFRPRWGQGTIDSPRQEFAWGTALYAAKLRGVWHVTRELGLFGQLGGGLAMTSARFDALAEGPDPALKAAELLGRAKRTQT